MPLSGEKVYCWEREKSVAETMELVTDLGSLLGNISHHSSAVSTISRTETFKAAKLV